MTYQIPVFVNGARGSAAFFFRVFQIDQIDRPGWEVFNQQLMMKILYALKCKIGGNVNKTRTTQVFQNKSFYMLNMLMLFFCANPYKAQATSIEIKNESSRSVYINDGFTFLCYDLNIPDIKIHYVNLPVNFDTNEMIGFSHPVLTSISILPSNKITKTLRGVIDFRKSTIVNNKEIFIEEEYYFSDVYFYLYYADKPFTFDSIRGSYKEYVLEMIKNGFIVKGYYNSDDDIVYFIITDTDYHIDRETVNDFINFVKRFEKNLSCAMPCSRRTKGKITASAEKIGNDRFEVNIKVEIK